MADLTLQQQRRVEGIVELIQEFLSARFEHAIRVNPSIVHVYQDLSWQQLVTLKQILSRTKAFGPLRFYVCDILASDDDAKKRALFLPTDQNTIMNEIVNLQEDKKETRHGILTVRDMRSFYRALDPSLERIVEVVQTMIWWDMPDAADMFSFDHEYQRVVKLAKQPLTDKIIDYYRKQMKRSPDMELSRNDILEYEVSKLEAILIKLRTRCDNEPGFQIIIKRDVISAKGIDDLVFRLATHTNNLKKIEAMNDLSDELREMYAKTLKITPQDVTRDIVIMFEKNTIEQLKGKLKDMLNMGQALGEPYNLKTRKVEQIEKRFEKIKQALFPSRAASTASPVRSTAE